MREPDGLPQDPDDLRLLLHALLDGETDAATSLALERRMAADAVLRADYARLQAVQGALRRLPPMEPSDAFRTRLAASLPRAVPVPSRASRPTFVAAWRALAAAVVVGVAVGSAGTLVLERPSAQGGFADAVAASHRRALLAASPIDVASADRHTVKPWLDARIGVSPPAPDLAAEGFALLGGRVEVLDGHPVPALVYRHKEHLVSVVAVPATGGGAANPPGDLAAGGFALVRWQDGAFSYWAVSDMERPELDDFVAQFRAKADAADGRGG